LAHFDTSGSLNGLDHDPQGRIAASKGLGHQLLQFEMGQYANAVLATGIGAGSVSDAHDVTIDTE
jgi:hypothetical protein